MPTITLKDLPVQVHRALKIRARRNRRSLNREAIACLEAAVTATPVDVEALLGRIDQARQSDDARLKPALLSEARKTGRP